MPEMKEKAAAAVWKMIDPSRHEEATCCCKLCKEQVKFHDNDKLQPCQTVYLHLNLERATPVNLDAIF